MCCEVSQVIQREGSFNIHYLETSHTSWLVGPDSESKGLELDKYARDKYVANRYSKNNHSSHVFSCHGKAENDVHLYSKESFEILLNKVAKISEMVKTLLKSKIKHSTLIKRLNKPYLYQNHDTE